MMYGFTVRNLKSRLAGLAGLPQEDAFAYNEPLGVACVADGVTRDFVDGSVLTKDIRGLAKILAGKYPPHAADVSGIAINTFMHGREVRAINNMIRNYNVHEGLFSTDYLGRDLAGCTFASFNCQSDPHAPDSLIEVDFQYIADAGFAIIGKEGSIIKSDDEGPHSPIRKPRLDEIVKENGGWTDSRARQIIRKFYRNNPIKSLSYGVLTGEESAMNYLKEMTLWVVQGDYALLFTDGIGELLFPPFDKFRGQEIRKEYADRIDDRDGLKKLCQKKVHSEGTLVAWKVE